jgi:exosome complex component CSL4
MRRIPKINDIIVGQVETATANVVNVKIHTVNELINFGKFTGMMLLKNQRDRRMRQRKITYKLGDIIRAKIKSTKNAIFHISIDCKECGVIDTFCSECGNNNMSREGQKLKCRVCGNIEERMFAPDFGSGQ